MVTISDNSHSPTCQKRKILDSKIKYTIPESVKCGT